MRLRFITIVVFVLGMTVALLVTPLSAADSEDVFAIHGRIVTEDGAKLGWLIYEQEYGKILKITQDRTEVPDGATVIKHNGYIFPGLIDTHNHVHWNAIPLWRTGETYDNRYEWQATDAYQEDVRGPFNALYDAGLNDEALKYGEIRALIGGTTTFQGTGSGPYGYLAKNLNLADFDVYSYVPNIIYADPTLLGSVAYYLQMGIIDRVFLHVGEGKRDDEDSLAEFEFLEYIGGTLPGIVIIHGVALTQDNYETMADNDMYLVWSPSSNLVLYGETADIEAALDAGVTVALGSDWSISGSDNLLEEMKAAWQYSKRELDRAITPKMLFQMVTTNAAEVAALGPDGWGLRAGRLEAGYQADFFLAPKLNPDPHVSLLRTLPKDIGLVCVDGVPVYGDRKIMNRLVPSSEVDVIRVLKKKKAIDIIDPSIGDDGEQHFNDLVEALEDEITDIAPLIETEPGGKPNKRCSRR